MTVLATPDFGASGGIVCMVMVAWVIALLIVCLGVYRGATLCQSESRQTRRAGVLILVASGLIPLCCCFGPSYSVRIMNGNYPLGSYPNNKIKEGMSVDEVVSILGTPHERHTQGESESWYYWIDSFSIRWFCVRFGPDGRVEGTHGN